MVLKMAFAEIVRTPQDRKMHMSVNKLVQAQQVEEG